MDGPGTDDTPVVGLPGPDRDDPDTPASRRHAEITERIRQLDERRRELAEHRGRRTTAEELARAREYVVRARAHARDARAHAAARHDLAGDAHLRAAALLDARGRPDRARLHRVAAEVDRAGGEADRAAAADEA